MTHPSGPGRSRHRAQVGIAGFRELVQAVPYLLGFHPWRSLVLVGVADGRLVVTARIDLPDQPSAPTDAVADTVAALVRGGSTAVVALVYPDAAPDAVPDPASGAASGELLEHVVAVLPAACRACGCDLVDVVLVSGGRWRSVSCTDPACCPAEGTPLPLAPSVFAAAATVDGVAPLGTRAELERVFAPAPADERAAVEPFVAEYEVQAIDAVLDGHEQRWRRAETRAVLAAARGVGRHDDVTPDPARIARLGVALDSTPVRDEVWLAIDEHRVDARALWLHLARRLPSPYDATPMFLHAWASWRAGDGASASIAVTRVLDSVPGYSAADLLAAALHRGVDPRSLPPLRTGGEPRRARRVRRTA